MARRSLFFVAFCIGCSASPAPRPSSSVEDDAEPPVCLNGVLLEWSEVHKQLDNPKKEKRPPALQGVVVGARGRHGRAIAREACRLSPAINRCRRETSEKGQLSGTLEIAFAVDEVGNLTSVRKNGGSGEPEDFERCVEQLFAGAHFGPASKGDAVWKLTLAKQGLVVKISEHGTSIQGGLPPEVVKRQLRANFPRLRACYEQLLKGEEKATATVVFDFLIDDKGAVRDVELTGSMTDASMLACSKMVLTSLTFPEPETGSAVVHYPLAFAAYYE